MPCGVKCLRYSELERPERRVFFAFSRQAIGLEKRPLMRRAEKPLTADGESPALLERELHYRAEGEAGV